ncbi:Serine/threonine-protein kinase PrkC [Nocardia otitidiscaviarum]|uniref:non-specific serine/threonine protein kinase n=1 Tax=Nocardia otitidiscaviarum TaxID=1823 RepID=A0A378YXM6_9NOCA|nr:serine/threonine-protein kinase [Nocardia otitidiscaviarum]SUA81191.1 Serine/threonine-protein kinase PrkC [Nocardia otitidiscaviarum]
MNSGRTVVDGRFELLEPLGSGGMGTVWRAYDIALHREVALKEVRTDASDGTASSGGAQRERVLREARALARIGHPNVVAIHHIVDAPSAHPWIVMELVRGRSLADRLAQGTMSPEQAARLGRGILAALRAAHAVGVLHRDIKPANVLLREDGSPVLTDFGIAAIDGLDGLTATGNVVGSLDYVAPERLDGQEGYPASDLWSLGLLLYVAVEGYHPLRRESTVGTLAAVLKGEVPPPQRAGALTTALAALLVPDPHRRPSAEQLDWLLAQATGPDSLPYPPPAATHLPPTTARPATQAPPAAPNASRTGQPAQPSDPHARAAGPSPQLFGSHAGRPGSYPTPVTPDPLFASGSDSPPQHANPPHFARGSVPRQHHSPPIAPGLGSPAAAAAAGTATLQTNGAGAAPAPRRGGRWSRVGLGAAAVVALVVAALVVRPGSSTPGADAPGTPVPSIPATEPLTTEPQPSQPGPSVDLLTPDGIRQAIAAFEQASGGEEFTEATFYPTYASTGILLGDQSRRYDAYTYRDGVASRQGPGGTLTGTETTVRLSSINWDILPDLLRAADAQLGVADPTSRYLIIDPAWTFNSDRPTIMVYLSDDYGGSAYLAADLDGTVVKVYPREN